QQALRRTMEKYSEKTRFVLAANYSSRIIEPIQSRCAVFRFAPLSEEEVIEIIDNIAKGEGLDLDNKAKKAVVYVADGDARKAANVMQGAHQTNDKITEEDVFKISSRARPTEISEMVKLARNGKFTDSRKLLDTLLAKYGMSGEEIILQIFYEVSKLDVDDDFKVNLIDKVGEFDFRVAEGARERIQLEALLAQLALNGKK
ncbi:MAG: replication factor C small subunit, partial [Candidatus Micrarchaeia archaeon]